MKEYELDIPEREYKIYWHSKFLRSYTVEDDFKAGLKFFNLFLICITGTYKGKSIDWTN